MDYDLTIDLAGQWVEREEIAACVDEDLTRHPFLSERIALPKFRINVALTTWGRTQTRHRRLRDTVNAAIQLHVLDLFEPPGVDCLMNALSVKLPAVFRHELGHVIDARMDPEFGFANHLRPTTDRLRGIHHCLWCSYVDARLGALAPYDLRERQEEAATRWRVPPELIARAWAGELRTYPQIVEAARAVRRVCRPTTRAVAAQ